MAAIRIASFGGISPATNKVALGDTAAQRAVNCKLHAGVLQPFKAPATVHTPTANLSPYKTIYRYDQDAQTPTQYWFTFTTDVDVVKGAVAGDENERTYYTGDGVPKVTDVTIGISSAPYPSSYFRLGIPAPSAPPTIVVSTAASPVPSTPAEDRVYVYTFVSAWGEESPPSLPSAVLTTEIGDTVTVSGLATAPTPNYNTGSGAMKRIYRVANGNSSTNYLFVAEIPIAQVTYIDTIPTVELSNVIPTLISDILPANAAGLTNMANGIMAAFVGYDVYLCEPYKPYSWPELYRQAVDYPVVGLGAFGSSLAILTTGNPAILTCTDPQSVSVEKLSLPYSCVSKRSICSAFGEVVYASPDGLVSIGPNGAKVITEALMTREEWDAYKPSSMMCALWDDRIFIFYDTGTVRGSLLLDGKQGLTESTVFATAAYNDLVNGKLYLCINNVITEWNAGTALTYTWKSKLFTHPNFVNFAWGQVLAEAYPVTLNAYINDNDTPVYTYTVADAEPFRLQSGFKARYWEIELVGSTTVYSVTFAESIDELKNV